jgi:type IV secretion system protein VirB4
MAAFTLKSLFKMPKRVRKVTVEKSVETSGQEKVLIREIPYTVLVDPRTVKTEHGGYVRSWRLSGVPFLTATDQDRNGFHEELCRTFIGRPDIQFYTHTVRRKVTLPEGIEFSAGSFPAGLSQRYLAGLKQRGVYENELYLSVVYTPRQMSMCISFRAGGKSCRSRSVSKP